MMDENETIADIVREIRDYIGETPYIDCANGDSDWEFFEGLSDRIEAAFVRNNDEYNCELTRLCEELAKANRRIFDLEFANGGGR